MKYRITWLAKFTGATGHGTGTFEHDHAVSIAKKLNEEHKDDGMVHAVEPVPDEEPEKN